MAAEESSLDAQAAHDTSDPLESSTIAANLSSRRDPKLGAAPAPLHPSSFLSDLSAKANCSMISSSSAVRVPYDLAQDQAIIDFLERYCETPSSSLRVTGDTIYKMMAQEQVVSPARTYQSLKNRATGGLVRNLAQLKVSDALRSKLLACNKLVRQTRLRSADLFSAAGSYAPPTQQQTPKRDAGGEFEFREDDGSGGSVGGERLEKRSAKIPNLDTDDKSPCANITTSTILDSCSNSSPTYTATLDRPAQNETVHNYQRNSSTIDDTRNEPQQPRNIKSNAIQNDQQSDQPKSPELSLLDLELPEIFIRSLKKSGIGSAEQFFRRFYYCSGDLKSTLGITDVSLSDTVMWNDKDDELVLKFGVKSSIKELLKKYTKKEINERFLFLITLIGFSKDVPQ
ncbi:MAG: hypothetical protein MHMPM18_002937 [Marteilia pararefringens]